MSNPVSPSGAASEPVREEKRNIPMLSEDLTTISEFRQNCTSRIDDVSRTGRPTFITRHGRIVAAVVSAEYYEETARLMKERTRSTIEESLAGELGVNLDEIKKGSRGLSASEG